MDASASICLCLQGFRLKFEHGGGDETATRRLPESVFQRSFSCLVSPFFLQLVLVEPSLPSASLWRFPAYRFLRQIIRRPRDCPSQRRQCRRTFGPVAIGIRRLLRVATWVWPLRTSIADLVPRLSVRLRQHLPKQGEQAFDWSVTLTLPTARSQKTPFSQTLRDGARCTASTMCSWIRHHGTVTK